MTKKEITARVDELLGQFKISGPAVPVEEIARGLGVEIRYLSFEGDVSGMLYRDDQREIIGVNSLQPANRQRFTIAHEIGHLLLHKGKKSLYVDSGFVNFRGVGSSDPEEVEANQFASALLMPERFLKADLANSQFDLESDEQVESLRKRYKVSAQAMSIRLSQVT